MVDAADAPIAARAGRPLAARPSASCVDVCSSTVHAREALVLGARSQALTSPAAPRARPIDRHLAASLNALARPRPTQRAATINSEPISSLSPDHASVSVQ